MVARRRRGTRQELPSLCFCNSLNRYPNGNNPGNFGCNATDILGTPGLCGQAGPQSPLPHWYTPDALEQAFVVGEGSDARVGGCFNLIGEANDRVLPCYCFFTAARMNRTTSCDWLNAEWYKTAVGKVVVVVLLFTLRSHSRQRSERVLGPQLQRL